MAGNGSRYKSKEQMTAGTIEQHRYNDISKSDKVISGMIPIPYLVIADATTAVYVGKGALVRVFGNGAAFMRFGGSTVTVPDVNGLDTILMPNATFFTVATDDYVRTSAAIRLEVSAD